VLLNLLGTYFFPHRLKKMPQSMPEYALTRNYLELMVELPWNKSTTGELTVPSASQSQSRESSCRFHCAHSLRTWQYMPAFLHSTSGN
jgi:hypothetical protein